MHLWGDDWEHWEDMGKMVDMAYEVFSEHFPLYGIKEKYGALRFYVSYPKGKEAEYRAGYEKLVKAYPHLRAEILVDADWHELLKGIVSEDDCDHKHYITTSWTAGNTEDEGDKEVKWCSVCGKDL